MLQYLLDTLVLSVCFYMLTYCLTTLNRMTKTTHEGARASVVALTLGASAKFILTISIAFPQLSMFDTASYPYLDKLWVVCVGAFLLLNRRRRL